MRWVQLATLPIALASAVIGGYSVTAFIAAEARHDAAFSELSGQFARLQTDLVKATKEGTPLTIRQSLPTSQPETSAETSAIASLREELDRLRNEQVRFQQAMSELMSNLAQGGGEKGASETDDIDDDYALETLGVKIEQDFEYETVDSDWGSWAELEIQMEFENGTPEGVQVISTECRSTVCRVEVDFEDALTKLEEMQSLTMLMPWPGESYMQSDETTDGNSVVLYVAREGESLSDEPR